MAAKKSIKSLDVKIAKGTQSVNFIELLQIGSDKLRLEIKSDSSDFQSYARISAWSPSEKKWNFLESVPFGIMNTPAKLIYKREEATAANFAQDRAELIRLALLVISE